MNKKEMSGRKALLKLAMAKGKDCYIQAKILMDKYDKLLINCANTIEKEQIATMGIAELHLLLDCYGDCVVNGKVIIPGDPSPKVE